MILKQFSLGKKNNEASDTSEGTQRCTNVDAKGNKHMVRMTLAREANPFAVQTVTSNLWQCEMYVAFHAHHYE